jgi:hypothetical protein
VHSSFSLLLPACAGFMLGLLFSPEDEDEDDVFLQSIVLSQNYDFATQ